MILDNTQRCTVAAELSVFEALTAIAYFADSCPLNLLPKDFTDRLAEAAINVETRILQAKQGESIGS